MHDGSQKTLEEVVEWYAKGGHPNPYLSDKVKNCLLYTSDAADDLLCVDLGGRRIIKKKKHVSIILQPHQAPPTRQHTTSPMHTYPP